MKYTKYFTIVIGVLLIIIVGEFIYLFSTDIYPQFTKSPNKTVSPQSNTNKTLIIKSNTQYNFNDYESGNYFTYNNDQDIQKLYISLKINGALREENGIYILPIRLADKNINLILGYSERKILFYDNTKGSNMVLSSVPLKDPINDSSLKEAAYIRISVPLSEYSDKEAIINDSRCNDVCKNSLLLIEKQISANKQFAKLLENEKEFLSTKNVSDIGPILDLIIINKNE